MDIFNVPLLCKVSEYSVYWLMSQVEEKMGEKREKMGEKRKKKLAFKDDDLHPSLSFYTVCLLKGVLSC